MVCNYGEHDLVFQIGNIAETAGVAFPRLAHEVAASKSREYTRVHKKSEERRESSISTGRVVFRHGHGGCAID